MAAGNGTFMCIDLKSFYASVECVDRGLDPFTCNLVVADPERSKNTICLAATPAIKKLGVKSRCRLGDIPQGIDYLIAVPRMHRYMEVSAQIVRTYLRFVAPVDLHVYSIDESFIDAAPYLRLYRCTARQLAQRMMRAVLDEFGITATAGIGPNLFLAKVALDLCAKHAPDGIGELDEESFRREMWFHRPLTDFWGIGGGIARRLARYGVFDLAGICAMRPATLYREFGKNAEFLIDHAWGLEPCTLAEIKGYVPRARSLSDGQVLMRDHSVAEARTLLREMAQESALKLFGSGLFCTGIAVWAGFPHAVLRENGPRAGAQASRKLSRATSNVRSIVKTCLELFDAALAPEDKVRRLGIALTGVVPAEAVQPTLFDESPHALKRESELQRAACSVRERFGANALLCGTSYLPEANARTRNQQIGGHRA